MTTLVTTSQLRASSATATKRLSGHAVALWSRSAACLANSVTKLEATSQLLSRAPWNGIQWRER